MEELEHGLGEIRDSCVSFTEIVLDSGLAKQYPYVSQQLHSILHLSASLAEIASENCDSAPTPTYSATSHSTAKVSNPIPFFQNSERDMKRNPTVNSTRVEATERMEPTDFKAPAERLLSDPWPSGKFPHESMPSIVESLATNALSIFGAYPSLNNSLYLPSTCIKIHEKWSFSQRLVWACCKNAHNMLIQYHLNHWKVHKVIGSPVNVSNRERLITFFLCALEDKSGEVVQRRTTVLSTLRAMQSHYLSERLKILQKSCGLSAESGSAQEWFDAHEVEVFLDEKFKTSITSSFDVDMLIEC